MTAAGPEATSSTVREALPLTNLAVWLKRMPPVGVLLDVVPDAWSSTKLP